jgi:type II secretory pathway pseudopilin PulG
MSTRSRTRPRPAVPAPGAERGASLVEILIAVTVLAIGVLGVGRIFPTSNRVQTQDRMTNTASYYAQQKLEEVLTLDWHDAEMQVGRFPAVNAESLGTNKSWFRHYEVEAMAEPLDNLRKVTVTVAWNYHGARSVTAVTYKRR